MPAQRRRFVFTVHRPELACTIVGVGSIRTGKCEQACAMTFFVRVGLRSMGTFVGFRGRFHPCAFVTFHATPSMEISLCDAFDRFLVGFHGSFMSFHGDCFMSVLCRFIMWKIEHKGLSRHFHRLSSHVHGAFMTLSLAFMTVSTAFFFPLSYPVHGFPLAFSFPMVLSRDFHGG